MTIANRVTPCDNCFFPVDELARLEVNGRNFCCGGCAGGGPCICAYDDPDELSGPVAQETDSASAPPQLPSDGAAGGDGGLPPSGRTFSWMAQDLLNAVEEARRAQAFKEGVDGPATDHLLGLLQQAAGLIQVMASRLEAAPSGDGAGEDRAKARSANCETVQLAVKTCDGALISEQYTVILDSLDSVADLTLLKVDSEGLFYQAWTTAQARLAREIMAAPGYRSSKIQASPGKITVFLEPVLASGKSADAGLPVEPGPPTPRDFGPGFPDRKAGAGVMEVGMTSFFNARHYLRVNGEPGPIEMKSWQVEIYLEGNEYGEEGTLLGADEAQGRITRLLAGYNNKLLNNIEPYDTIAPTPENIARTLYSQLRDCVLDQPLWVKGLKVWVSPTQYVWYSEPARHEA